MSSDDYIARLARALYPDQPSALLAPSAMPPNPLSALANFATPPVSNALADAIRLAGQNSPPGNALLGLSALASLTPSPLGTTLLAAVAPKRRVFFSFHYQQDINRVNVVRNAWRIRPEDGTQPANWFDHSIWEDAKKTGQSALKKLIHEGMNGSSVTCVLAGAETWARPWVRYEIAYGVARGNGLMTVFINGVKCMNAGVCDRGPNPLDYLGLKWGDDGKAYIWEKFGGQWRAYPLYKSPISWPSWLPNVTERRLIRPLSHGGFAYDYAKQDGYKNLSGWAQLAADRAGK